MEEKFYEEGKAAFYGCARWENPYPQESDAGRAWDAGYASEEAEHYR